MSLLTEYEDRIRPMTTAELETETEAKLRHSADLRRRRGPDSDRAYTLLLMLWQEWQRRIGTEAESRWKTLQDRARNTLSSVS